MSTLRAGVRLLRWAGGASVLAAAFLFGCAVDDGIESVAAVVAGTPTLLAADIQAVLTQGVTAAREAGVLATVAVVSREGDLLGVFRMDGAPAGALPFPGMAGTQPCDEDGVNCAIAKARTAAFFSSNGEAFSSRTAAFIVDDHFPPGISNTPGGPLFGVQNSSLAGGDVQPTGNGITGVPGGLPLFKGDRAAGGLGIAGDRPEDDESLALAAQAGFAPPSTLTANRILVDGIRLPYTQGAPAAAPAGLVFADLGTTVAGTFVVPVAVSAPTVRPLETLGGVTGEVWLPIAESARADANRLLEADVRRILAGAAARAALTRAAIRRPLGVPAQVFISVVDVDGSVLGSFRTPDATLFSFDVSVQKARTAVFFSGPGVDLDATVAAFLAAQGLASFNALFGLPAGQRIAVSCRALGFLSQGLYPPGIDGNAPGPLSGLQGALGLGPLGNGITIFPGGFPLYKNGALTGGIGISGDGVDQDDIIGFAGTEGFEPPADVLRADALFVRGARLPYVRFPRNPGGGVGEVGA